MATKPGIWQDGDLAWLASTHKVTQTYGHGDFQDHVTNQNHDVSTTAMPIAPKLGRMITYLDGRPPIKSNESLITWFFYIVLKTKSIMSAPRLYLWPQNMASWWLTLRGSHPDSHMTFLSSSLARWRGKLKTYLSQYNIYGHQTWQSDDIQWGVPIQVTWCFDHKVLWGHVTN